MLLKNLKGTFQENERFRIVAYHLKKIILCFYSRVSNPIFRLIDYHKKPSSRLQQISMKSHALSFKQPN